MNAERTHATARSRHTRTPTERAARSFSRVARNRRPKRDCLKRNATATNTSAHASRERYVVVGGTLYSVLVPRVIDVVWTRNTFVITRIASVAMPACTPASRTIGG